MIRLVYFSTADADIKPTEIDAIISVSVVKNAEHEITGALGYNGRNFCQCLEGPEDNVRALVATIEKDPRHSGFKIVDEKEIDKRHFEGWAMLRVDGLNFSPIIDAMRA